MINRRTVAEIDLNAVDINIKNIKAKVGKNTRVLGTIKADGYGHGALEIYKVLKENGVDIFSTATLDEALYLREHCVGEDILILGFTPKALFGEVIENNIIQTVYSMEQAIELNEAGKHLGKVARVHIKVDTGMSRIGFLINEKEIEDVIKINIFEFIKIEGIFTHFAISDSKDKEFTQIQKERFILFNNELEKKGVIIPLKHCANSGAIIDCEDTYFNLVRPGIILYGLYPSEEVEKNNLKLMSVMSIKTQIGHIKYVDDNMSVSYGRTYFTEGVKKVATLPIGYADGYSRQLSNKGMAIVKGKKVPIIGRVCMDQCMIDVTDIDDINVEDEVILMGRCGDEEISAEDLATAMGTINYEVVCLFSQRVPRVYVRS